MTERKKPLRKRTRKPRAKKPKKTVLKQISRNARKGVGRRQMVISKTPLPAHFRTKLSYSTQQYLTISAANTLSVALKANSLYDTDYTGNMGNKQPWSFDTICASGAPYQRYRVLNVSVSFKFTLITDPTVIDLTYSVQVSGNGNIYYGGNRNAKLLWCIETPFMGADMESYNNQYAEMIKHPSNKKTPLVNRGSSLTFTKSANVLRTLKKQHQDTDINDTAANYNFDPAALLWYHILLTNDDASYSQMVLAEMNVVYDCDFFNENTTNITT